MADRIAPETDQERRQRGRVKCLVWDLDNTLWDGVLLEDRQVPLRRGVTETIRTLDERGILQSIASKNDHAAAMEQVEAYGLREYFLYPQINWSAKSHSVESIAKSLNIGLDALAFVDDDPAERDEVKFSLPDVLCIDSSRASELLLMPEMNPRFITADSRRRRSMYISNMEREKAEEEAIGPKEEFLASLEMRLTVSAAKEPDLRRAEELTIRTHQLNTTGCTYSYDELNRFRLSPSHRLFIAELEDKYGRYGKIGLALLECQETSWTIKLLLMSCRVMSRGVGTVLIHHIMQLARAAGVLLRAEYVANEHNRIMYVTYKFAGFKEAVREGDHVTLESAVESIPPLPDYVTVNLKL